MSRNSFDGLDWINFKASGLDFVESESKTGRFLGVSVVFHATLFVLTSLIVIPALEPKRLETIAFDFIEGGGSMTSTPIVASPAINSQEPKTKSESTIVTKKNSPAHSRSFTTTAAKTSTNRAAPAVAKAVVHQSQVPEPQSLDDIVVPQLEESDVSMAPIGVIDDKDFSEDLNAIDAKSRKQITAEQQQLAAQTGEVESDSKVALSAAEAANRQEIEKLNRGAAALRAKNKNSLGNGQGLGRGQGQGGTPGAIIIRPIQDLRQLPGNSRPEYSKEERLKGDQGKATFLAYVSKGGKLSNFKLAQSTGHRNLDLKTLTALKQWRFYPGQEGWVEIPIQWDLRGGAQEIPTLLRRTNI